ncbi:TetR family transcriptional regulator [Mycolicibacterium madagascariense]|uniref:TetR family transcriptional regulator n=1 Tax=Mycolicibacterium madagascariense TaxID=212765 RepID=A0A7I7XET2_9MYCO|nr:TetR/AcrR family transcriptional regulator [Mycolicibacterium madagascariense]MCV7015388.1 TetR/AcrR family transcriptional regulator [Mycolicibacterium madagascariense]BBZ27686.1 TetR family transcriptional regulator [Mycolicibacterium madagascariense]
MPATTTDDEILRCARSLLIDGGYNGFSYADIAAAVGIRKASIHYYYPTKVDLVRALVARYREEADAGFAEMTRRHPEPVDQLRAYIGFWADCILDGTNTFCLCALLATQIPVLPPEVVTEVKAYFQVLSTWLAAVLENGREQGRFTFSGTAQTEAEKFMAAVHGAMLSARAYSDPAVFTLVTDPLLEAITA